MRAFVRGCMGACVCVCVCVVGSHCVLFRQYITRSTDVLTSIGVLVVVQHQHAAMVMFVWSEDTQTMRDVWKCVLVDTGDMSVPMDGTA